MTDQKDGKPNQWFCEDCNLNLDLTREEQEFICAHARQVSYGEGETIMKQGTFATHVILVKRGLVKVLMEASNKKRVGVEILTSGSLLGLPFLQTEQFYAGAEALSETDTFQIKKEAMNQVIGSNGQVKDALIQWYSRHVVRLHQKLEINSSRNSHGKLASVLYSLCQEKYEKEDVFKYITRKDLAELSSISKESTNKILREFEHDRLIRVSGPAIEVLRPELLQRLSFIG
jgi:CRP/FNR family transcriptional regulator